MAKIHFTIGYHDEQPEIARWRYLLPILLEKITGKRRYLPEIEFTNSNWTHSVFRLYEWVFFREYGVRKEWGYDQETGFKFFTVEARIAHTEGLVRAFLRKFQIVWVPVYAPQLAFAGRGYAPEPIGFVPTFPYLLAVARDDTENDQGASGSASRTVIMTCSGSDRALAGFPFNGNSNRTVSSFTYDSVSMGTVVGSTGTLSAGGTFRSYVKAAPNTTAGANLSVTYDSKTYIYVNAVAYTGVDQTTPADGHNEDATSTSVASRSVTFSTTGTGAWISGASLHESGGTISGTGSFTKIASGVNGAAIHDTNGTVSVGSNTVGSSSTLNGGTYLVAVGIQPPQATNVTVNATVVAATFSVPASTQSGGATVSPSATAATFSTPAPAISGASNVTAGVVSATFTIPAVNVITPDSLVDASVVSATFSVPAPTVSGDANTAVGVLTATFSVPSASVQIDATVDAGVQVATFSIPSPTVSAISNISVSAGVVSATFSIPAPTVTGEVNALVEAGVLTATFTIPAATVTAIMNVEVSATVLTATFSVQTPRKVGGVWTAQPRVNGDAAWTPQPRAI